MTAPRSSSPQIVLAFDFGLKRIGVASGDSVTASATPRAAVAMTTVGPDWVAIEREVRALQPHLLVVGAPYNVDGSANAMSDAARVFAAELESRFRLPVQQVDERYSSLQASAVLKDKRASGSRRRRVSKEDIDSAAAAVILERWFAGEGERDE